MNPLGGSLLEWFLTQPDADEDSFMRNKKTNVQVGQSIIIGITPAEVGHDALGASLLDFHSAVVSFADKVDRHGKGGQLCNGSQTTTCGGSSLQVETTTDVPESG